MKAIVTIGISGSGKSTYAAKLEQEGWYRIERDLIRRELFGFKQWGEYKFSKGNENLVNQKVDENLQYAKDNELDIIISDTNLNPKYSGPLIKKLEAMGWEVDLMYFDITIEEAWKRDQNREYSVGRDVIYKQWKQWHALLQGDLYKPSGILPDCIIYDIDGTLATMHNRGPFEWDKVGQDKPRKEIFYMLDGFARKGYDIVFLSGRDEVCRTDTTKWLNYFLYEFCDSAVQAGENNLFMRKQKDMRKDNIVKSELFWNDVVPKWDVKGVVDDRPQVIRNVWLPLGIENVIIVGDPWDEF